MPPVARHTLRRFLCAVLVGLVALGSARVATARDFIWKVSDKHSVVYVVGSVHLLSKDYYPLGAAMESAFKASGVLVEEVDLGEMLAPQSQLDLLTRGILPSKQSLDTVISPAAFALVVAHTNELGLPIEPLKRFKPWALALTLMGLQWQNAGFDASFGLDKHFYDRAQAEGKPVRGLETTEFQIAQLDGMSARQQERLLVETLKETGTEMASITKLADAWKAGDAPTVEHIVLQDLRQDAEMYQRLLVDRNRTWLPLIEALFGSAAPAFVVVGAAHLVGPDGLLAMLKAKGYTLEQL